jgi:hypothetical protein
MSKAKPTQPKRNDSAEATLELSNLIQQDFALYLSELKCASVALVKAEDDACFNDNDAGDLASSAITVIQQCCSNFAALEEKVSTLSLKLART